MARRNDYTWSQSQTLATAPTHERLTNKFKAMRRGGHDFFEKPLPVAIEDSCMLTAVTRH